MNEPPVRPLPCRQGIVSPLAFLTLSRLFSYLEPGSLFPPSLLLSSSHSFVCFLACFVCSCVRTIRSLLNLQLLAWSWTRASIKRVFDPPSFILIPSNSHTDLCCIHSAPFSRRPPPRSDPRYCQHLYYSASQSELELKLRAYGY